MYIKKSARSLHLPYPANLVADVEEKAPLDFPRTFQAESTVKDFIPSVEYVLSRIPSEEAALLHLAFGANGGEPMSYTDAGKEMGFSGDKVHRLISDACFRLRQPEFWKMLTIGIDAYILLLRAQAGEESAKEHLANIEKKRQSDLDFWTSISIEEMMLPEHEYHILSRGGFKTVADVVNAGPKIIRRQRNCGKRAFQIIMSKLEKCDVDLTAWQEWVDRKD